MRSLAVDNDGNLMVGTTFKIVDGIDAIIQDIKTRLRLLNKEYHFDLSAGVPYFELLKDNNKQTFQNEILEEVYKDDRVKTAKITESDLTNGVLKMKIEILTNQGNLIII